MMNQARNPANGLNNPHQLQRVNIQRNKTRLEKHRKRRINSG